MCTQVFIEGHGRHIECDSVRALTRFFPVIIECSYRERRNIRPLRRMATHCLCPVDVEASAKASGYDVEWDPWGYRVKKRGVGGGTLKPHRD